MALPACYVRGHFQHYNRSAWRGQASPWHQPMLFPRNLPLTPHRLVIALITSRQCNGIPKSLSFTQSPKASSKRGANQTHSDANLAHQPSGRLSTLRRHAFRAGPTYRLLQTAHKAVAIAPFPTPSGKRPPATQLLTSSVAQIDYASTQQIPRRSCPQNTGGSAHQTRLESVPRAAG